MRYYVQFPAGTSALVAESIGTYVQDPDVVYADDSSMIFETDSQRSEIEKIPFVKNSFTVIADALRRGIETGVMELSETIESGHPDSYASTFRVMCHVDGELVSIDSRVRSGLESTIAAASGRSVAARGLGEEYWVVGRTDFDRVMLCRRHSRPRRPAKARGAVSYELSAMLVAASRPRAGDVFLDPFAGSGSFAEARLSFPAKRIVYSDINLEHLRNDFAPALRGSRRVAFLSDDALRLPSVEDHGVDVIVTDPPWGEYEQLDMAVPEFLDAMAHAFDRVLDPLDGRFVTLTSRKAGETAEEALGRNNFRVDSTHEVLVHGHPATVLIGGRT